MTAPLAGRRAFDNNGSDAIETGGRGLGRNLRRAIFAWRSPRRLALGLLPTPRLGLVLLPLGMAFGPLGLDLMSERVLTALDPAVSAALSALGVLIGMRLDTRSRREWTLAGAASIEALVTTVTIAAGLLLIQVLSPGGDRWPWAFALLLGACAAPSSSAALRRADDPDSAALQLADLDDLLPIALGLVALASVGLRSGPNVLSIAAQTAMIAVLIAVAGVLLVSQTASESEQRVFVIGTVLMLAGAAAHLMVPALFTGLVAGVVFGAWRSDARVRFEQDLRYMQHPLVALLLVVAGARFSVPSGWLAVFGVYLVFRMAGKLASGWLTGLVVPGVPRDSGLSLISPGVVGVALALNARQALAGLDETPLLFAAVVAGSIASELLSLILSRPESEA